MTRYQCHLLKSWSFHWRLGLRPEAICQKAAKDCIPRYTSRHNINISYHIPVLILQIPPIRAGYRDNPKPNLSTDKVRSMRNQHYEESVLRGMWTMKKVDTFKVYCTPLIERILTLWSLEFGLVVGDLNGRYPLCDLNLNADHRLSELANRTTWLPMTRHLQELQEKPQCCHRYYHQFTSHFENSDKAIKRSSKRHALPTRYKIKMKITSAWNKNKPCKFETLQLWPDK